MAETRRSPVDGTVVEIPSYNWVLYIQTVVIAGFLNHQQYPLEVVDFQ